MDIVLVNWSKHYSNSYSKIGVADSLVEAQQFVDANFNGVPPVRMWDEEREQWSGISIELDCPYSSEKVWTRDELVAADLLDY